MVEVVLALPDSSVAEMETTAGITCSNTGASVGTPPRLPKARGEIPACRGNVSRVKIRRRASFNGWWYMVGLLLMRESAETLTLALATSLTLATRFEGGPLWFRDGEDLKLHALQITHRIGGLYSPHT